MKRKLYGRLLEWKHKEADECALLIDGARRVGKSYIAEEFAKYKSNLATPIVFHSKDLSSSDNVMYLPLYMVECL